MSTLKTGALRGTSGTADSIQLHASDQSVTFPGAVTIAGALTSSTTAVANKILQIQHANWTTEESLSNSFVSMASKSVTPIESNSDWLFIGQPARMLLKPGEIKADVYDSTNSNATGRREWRNYMSGVDSRPGCTSIWYHTAWNLSAGSAVTFQLRYYSDNSNNTVGDGSVSSDFIIIEVAT